MQFLVPGIHPGAQLFEILGDEARHIATVLRKKQGDLLRLFDGKGNIYWGEITLITQNRIEGRVLENPPLSQARGLNRSFNLTLYQALPKGQKWDWVLEKGCELGISRFVPVLSSRVISNIEAKNVASKMQRWQRVIQAACKQSGLAVLPQLHEPMNFDRALNAAIQDNDLVLMAWESEKAQPIWQIVSGIKKKPQNIGIFIGPEGGWSLDEVQEAEGRGCLLTGLGPHVLRAETAPIVAVSMFYALAEFSFPNP